MKNYKLLFATCFILFLLACNNRDNGDTTIQNQFVFGNTYDLTNGFAIDLFGPNGDGSYNWLVYVTSSSIDFVDNWLTGTGDFVLFDLNTPSDMGLVSGKYMLENDPQAFNFTDASIGIGANFDRGGGSTYKAVSGELHVDVKGEEVTLRFNLELVNGTTVEGSFSGVFELIK